MKNFIIVSKISKTYIMGNNLFDSYTSTSNFSKIVFALKDVSFNVDKGEIVALTGHNGAGKTTILRLLSTLLTPDQGSISINGKDTRQEENSLKSKIGVMWCDERSFYWRLSIRGNLEFYATLYNLNKKESRDRIDALCERLHITEPQKRFQECSTGVKQRCALARALLNRPDILLMDEPTRSLDTEGASSIRDFIIEIVKNQNVTALIATHNLDDSRIANKIIKLKEGRINNP